MYWNELATQATVCESWGTGLKTLSIVYIGIMIIHVIGTF